MNAPRNLEGPPRSPEECRPLRLGAVAGSSVALGVRLPPIRGRVGLHSHAACEPCVNPAGVEVKRELGCGEKPDIERFGMEDRWDSVRLPVRIEFPCSVRGRPIGEILELTGSSDRNSCDVPRTRRAGRLAMIPFRIWGERPVVSLARSISVALR
jgi:hypothetical protein